MWLPKRERRLLAAYALNTQINTKNCDLSDNELVSSLGLKDLRELYVLKTRLKRRNLLTFSNLKEEYANTDLTEAAENEEAQTILTEQGLVIGRKYCTNIGTFELWSRNNIWFWFLLGMVICLVAVFITLLIAW